MAAARPAEEAEDGIQKWKKENEKEEEEAAAGPCMGEEALRKAPEEGKPDLHPLLNRWALWFFKNDRSRAWQNNLHRVTKFNTVEDFWAIYNNIQLASKLSSGCDYALFKDGIKPMWEDSRNKRGGRWLVSLTKQQRHIELDHLWLETACLQRAPGPLHKDHHWVPGPRRYSHQEQLLSQEQICGVRGP
ncbi:eukaryotic translation initiation factor 4E type 1B isoform X2 [Bubalus bubalis]|uniref:eukaryotic translation initiation factor 4E type 1B isoform X2 n=1 Tax=Bubalus bubalis TaxID=89462 RepID=UPI001D124DE2|nr:eukaryotic translation initiation factor 4E type 1B isoform X2 [Bubalus bubalis]